MRTQEEWFDLMLTTTTELFFEKETALLNAYYERNGERKLSVLDIGCGNGAYLSRLNYKFPLWSCTGLEMNEPIYRFAQTKASTNLTFIHTAYEDFHPEDPYDYVMVRLVAAHLKDLPHFMRWLRERIHPDSVIVIIDAEEDIESQLKSSKVLPLFSELYQKMRKPLQASKLLSLKDSLALEAVYAGLEPINLFHYGVRADSADIREQIYSYMRFVSGVYYGSSIPPEREMELQLWYESPDESFEIGMFSIVLQPKTQK